MSGLPRATAARRRLKSAGDAMLGHAFVGTIKTLRIVDRKRMAGVASAVTRTFGPRLKEHKLAREQLVAPSRRNRRTKSKIQGLFMRGTWIND